MTKETVEKIIRHNRAGIAAHQISKEIEKLKIALSRFIEECEGVGLNYPPSPFTISEAHKALGTGK